MPSWQLQRGTMTLRPASEGAGNVSFRRCSGRTGAAGAFGGGSGIGSGTLFAGRPSWESGGGFADASIGGAGKGRVSLGNAVHAHAPPAIKTVAAAARVTHRRPVCLLGRSCRSRRIRPTVCAAKSADGVCAFQPRQGFDVMNP